VKPSALFSIAILLAVGILAYTSFVPADSPSSLSGLAGPDTARLRRGESIRSIIFVGALGMASLAVVLAFWKPRIAALLWCAVLVVVAIRWFLPSFPVQLFPFASAVFWAGLIIQGILCYFTFRALRLPAPAIEKDSE
jgi:hypothetical protein